MAIEKETIISSLRQMGVSPGDSIGMHSNVPSLGRVVINAQKQGGADAVRSLVNEVIDAFLEAIDSARAVLMVPTFSYCFAGDKDGRAYNPQKTPSRVGLFTEIFRQRSDARRSLAPTHSVAAIGAEAETIIKDHENRTPLGNDSPFHRLARRDGWICFLGTNSGTLSLLHVAEAIAKVPYVDVFCYEYLGWRPAALVEQPDGGIEEVGLKKIPGCSESFFRFDEMMRRERITRTGMIYQSHVTMFKAAEALDLAVDKLRQDPFCLICEKGKCQACDVRWKACGR